MVDDENADAGDCPLPVEIVVAAAAGVSSWFATPPAGVVMHWGPDNAPGWALGAVAYGGVAAVLTFLIGHFLSRWVSGRFGVDYIWPAPLSAGALWISLAGFQHIWPTFLAFVAAAVVAIVVYFVSIQMAIHKPVPHNGSKSSEVE